MSFSNLLSVEQKKSIVEARIIGWAEAVYDQEVVKEALVSRDPDADTSAPDGVIAELNEAITSAQETLMALETERLTSA